ncbi:MAG: glycosyltransferase [Bacteroidota bacterium]
MNNDLRVSVCMITYNHESFIQEAIEGVMMQETTFPVQLIIGEDCSTDNTRELCIKYKNLYPERITLVLQEINVGAVANFYKVIDQCMKDFKYVAMCEGDDYWIDPLKLQKQVDLLESDSNIGLAFTEAKIFDNESQEFIPKEYKSNFPAQKEVIPELLKSNFVEFATTVFRTIMLKDIWTILAPQFSKDTILTDTPLVLESAKWGRIGYMPEETTVYRISQGSISRPKTYDKYLRAIQEPFYCRKIFVERHNLDPKLLKYSICNYNKSLINRSYEQSNYYKAIKLLIHLKVWRMFQYCDWKTLKNKMPPKIFVKFFLVILGVSAIKNYIKNQQRP